MFEGAVSILENLRLTAFGVASYNWDENGILPTENDLEQDKTPPPKVSVGLVVP